MNIKDAGTRSGVSVRNIRFYEQKGLLSPARNPENDYRDYSEEDVERLKFIRALRMVDMPLEQIRGILSGSALLCDAALEHCGNLTSQIRKLETAVHFCQELASGEVTDVDALLERMDAADEEKLLPRHWVSDYAEAVKAMLVPLCAGLVPIVLGTVAGVVSIWFAALWPPLVFLAPVLYLFCWGWIGYALCQGENPGRSVLLAHVFPAYFLVCCLYYQMLPFDGMPHPFLELGIAYHMPLIPFTFFLKDYLQEFSLCFVLMLIAFSFGALLARRRCSRPKQSPLPDPITPSESQA